MTPRSGAIDNLPGNGNGQRRTERTVPLANAIGGDLAPPLSGFGELNHPGVSGHTGAIEKYVAAEARFKPFRTICGIFPLT